MVRRGRLFLGLGAALLLVRTARADDEVLVRGASGNFSSRATIEDSPRQITDAASLVESMPGVHVRRLGADDSFASLSIRGSTSTQGAVYMAGVPLSGGADPTLDLATLPLWPGARATVHRTFAPAALGRGSLGGTLAIDPPSPRSKEATEVWAAAGSYDALRLRVGDVRTVGNVRFATGLSASRSDDDFTYFDQRERRDVTRVNAGHAAAAGLELIALPIPLRGTDGALTITLLAQTRRQELPGSILRPTPYQRLDFSRLVEALELTLPAGSGAMGARAWARREGFQLRDDPDEARSVSQPSSTDDAIVAAGGSVGWKGRPADPLLLEVRLDGSGERYAPGTWGDATSPPGATRTSAGVAADASLVAGPAIVSASGRGDAWIDSSAAVNQTEYRPTGHVGIEVPAGPIVLAAHSGFVTRPASFVERYGNRGAFITSPGLKPESAFTTDAGARVSHRIGPVKLRAELAGFATWADDLITYIYQGFQHFARAVNVGEARIYGLESEVRGGAYGVDLRVSYTGLLTANDTICLSRPSGCERPPLQGRPAHDFVADLSYARGPVRVRYGIDYVSGIRIDDRANIEVPSRMLHGASISMRVAGVDGLTLTLDVRNLFDLRTVGYPGIAGGTTRQPIGDLYDYPLPGRRVLFSAAFTTR
jgi:hypothetical protein